MNDQRSTTEQLRDLIRLANESGLYDAADFLRRHVREVDERVKARGWIGEELARANDRAESLPSHARPMATGPTVLAARQRRSGTVEGAEEIHEGDKQ